MKVTGSSTEIRIEYGNLEEAIANLQRLQNQVASRKLQISFRRAQGNVPEQMEELAASLRNAGAALASVIGQTAAWMEAVNSGFQSAEAAAADSYDS